MNIISGITSGNSSQQKQDKLTHLTSKNVECQKQPLFVRPICNEEKIRAILNVQDPHVKLYQQQRSQKKMWKEMQQQQKEKNNSEKTEKIPQQPSSDLEQPQQVRDWKKQNKLNCYWSELVKLQGLPVSSVRAYWTQQHRCIIVTAKAAQLDKEWQRQQVQDDHFSMENVSPLTNETRWTEEKNLHRLKRVIPVPTYVCAKDLECFLDTERRVFIVCARRSKLSPPSSTSHGITGKSQPQLPLTCEQWVDKECLLPGSEQELHQRCQPSKSLLKSLLSTSGSSCNSTTAVDDWQRLCKSITEDSDWHGVAQLLREQLKELKRSTFPGLLQSPRFVKDEKSGQWSLRLQLRLRSAPFRAEDVRVRSDEKRHTVLVEALREVRDALTRRVVQIRVEIPLSAWVEVGKLKTNFVPQEGLLRLEIPLNRDQLQEWQKQQQQAIPKAF